jgi:hypothetical protein
MSYDHKYLVVVFSLGFFFGAQLSIFFFLFTPTSFQASCSLCSHELTFNLHKFTHNQLSIFVFVFILTNLQASSSSSLPSHELTFKLLLLHLCVHTSQLSSCFFFLCVFTLTHFQSRSSCSH